MILCDNRNSLHQEKPLENLDQLFGKTAVSRARICFWFGEFRRRGGVSMMRTGDSLHGYTHHSGKK